MKTSVFLSFLVISSCFLGVGTVAAQEQPDEDETTEEEQAQDKAQDEENSRDTEPNKIQTLNRDVGEIRITEVRWYDNRVEIDVEKIGTGEVRISYVPNQRAEIKKHSSGKVQF
ncbi:hypothetical protein [Haloarcula regularis]|uniref:hypothetical protein n=1 Tax=Haloarcula regularis TaxID=3033392 RepID=UPI0023E85089|nr:hypothetical protein [Halomicroarcula sp. SYNS111]